MTGSTRPCAAVLSPSPAPLAASPDRSSSRRIPFASGNTGTASRRSSAPLLRPTDLATTARPLGAASPRSLRACVSSGAFKCPPLAKAYFREDHFSGGRPTSDPACRARPRSSSRSTTCSSAGIGSPALSTMAGSASRTMRPSAPCADLRQPSHCALLHQVSVNIGSVSVSARRHGRPFRVTADWTCVELRSSARI